MEKIEKRVTIRNTMRKMKVDEIIEFPRDNFRYKPLTIRSTAGMIKENYGQGYKVSVSPEKITVTRIN
jgi:hypothetical protein